MTGSTKGASVDTKDWWYEDDGETKGPVSGKWLLALIGNQRLRPDALAWREGFGDQWKPIDQTELLAKGTTTPNQMGDDDPKWQKTFAAFDAATDFHYERSWAALIFGPLYYFYLGMWRKGLVIVGISIWASLVVEAVSAVVGLTLPQKALGFGANAFCCVYAKRDYYQLKRFGQRMWPALSWLDSRWTIAALLVSPMLLVTVAASFVDDNQTARSAAADSPAPAVADQRSTVLAPTPLSARMARATGELKDSWDPRDRPKASPTRIAERACEKRLQELQDGRFEDKYDAKAVHTYKTVLHGGDLIRTSAFFGGHQFINFDAQIAEYINGRLQRYINVPVHVCVLDDDYGVIGMEVSQQDGLK